MKTIGLIGGTTWHSSMDYYRLINELVNKKIGGRHSAKLLMYSVDFEDVLKHRSGGDWEGIGKLMCGIARTLENAGADCLLLGANTLHIVAGQVQQSIRIPLIHITEETAKKVNGAGISRVGLLGTQFTMEEPFYREVLEKHGIHSLIPEKPEREYIQQVIYEEFSNGIFNDATRAGFIRIIKELQANGAEGIILGCTEIPLLVKQEHCDVPLFDTMLIHSEAAVEFALK